jgi:trehalose 6-phosphate synthase/phosphatase
MPEAVPTKNLDPDSVGTDFLLGLVRSASSLCLLVDYDGTLVPIMPRPGLALPDAELLVLLDRLSARPRTSVHIVSGRARSQLDTWFGALPVGLHAEHGVWSRTDPSQPWERMAEAVHEWGSDIVAALRQSCSILPGSLIEVKTASLTFHFRQVQRDLVASAVPLLRARLALLAPHHNLDVVDGAEVIELRVPGVSKATSVRLILERITAGTVLVAFGDDTTDEDMFRALPPEAMTVRVGPGTSIARHRFAGPVQVRSFLSGLLGQSTSTPAVALGSPGTRE